MRQSAPASPSWPFRVVADTNVFVSAIHPEAFRREMADGFRKPLGLEFLERAFYDQFVLIMTAGTFFELIEKLEEFEVPERLILELAQRLRDQADEAQPDSSERFCSDADDDKFVHAAIAGRASHIVSQDRHLKGLVLSRFTFTVVVTMTFLRDLRAELKRQRLES